MKLNLTEVQVIRIIDALETSPTMIGDARADSLKQTLRITLDQERSMKQTSNRKETK